MKRPNRTNKPLVIALFANAGVLVLILLAIVSRSDLPSLTPSAYGQQAPIGGGGGIFVVPGQMSQSTYGVYLMDIDTQVLCAYQFYPGEKQLRLVATRNFSWDRRLKLFNTAPDPREIQTLVERELKANRVMEQNTAPQQPEAPAKE